MLVDMVLTYILQFLMGFVIIFLFGSLLFLVAAMLIILLGIFQFIGIFWTIALIVSMVIIGKLASDYVNGL